VSAVIREPGLLGLQPFPFNVDPSHKATLSFNYRNEIRRDPEHIGRAEVSCPSSSLLPVVGLSSTLQDISLDGYDDPNFDPTATLLLDESPYYPEVRSAVVSTDDPEMPSSTFRAWVIGLLFAIILSGVNQFLYFKYPSVQIYLTRPHDR
jgi:hypothetical protein